jgi:Ca-activated chloride channel homolog
LVGIFALIISYNISFGWNKKKSVKFANFDAISKVTRQTLFPRRTLPLLIRGLVLVFIILGISGFGIWYNGTVSDIDYILAIDSSGSMLADDFEPTRLEAAKAAAIDFVDGLGAETNLGVISFTGTAVLDQPLTTDKQLVKEAISGIGGVYAAGTSIGDALTLASSIFGTSELMGKSRAVILLTDGQTNVGLPIDDAVTYAEEQGVVVHVMGIGTEEGGTFIDDLAISTIDYDTLGALAEDTGGNFYLIGSEEEMRMAYAEISNSSEGRVFVDSGRYLLLIACIFLLVEWILANTRYKTII